MKSGGVNLGGLSYQSLLREVMKEWMLTEKRGSSWTLRSTTLRTKGSKGSSHRGLRKTKWLWCPGNQTQYFKKKGVIIWVSYNEGWELTIWLNSVKIIDDLNKSLIKRGGGEERIQTHWVGEMGWEFLFCFFKIGEVTCIFSREGQNGCTGWGPSTLWNNIWSWLEGMASTAWLGSTHLSSFHL